MKLNMEHQKIIVSGYVNATERESGVMVNSQLNDGKPFKEIISSGAFGRALKEQTEDIIITLNHNRCIGSLNRGQIELYENSVGLRARAAITDEETIQKLDQGLIRGWSFAFKALSETWIKDGDGMDVRRVHRLRLYDVALCEGEPKYASNMYEYNWVSPPWRVELQRKERVVQAMKQKTNKKGVM